MGSEAFKLNLRIIPGCKAFLMLCSESLGHINAVAGVVVEVDKLPG